MTASASLACPSLTQNSRALFEVTGPQFAGSRGFNVMAGGNFDLADCDDIQPQNQTGPGSYAGAADFSFQLSDMDRYVLELRVLSQCNPSLLVNLGGVAWFYDDDSNGDLNPKLLFTEPPNARIDVWVGTDDGGICPADLIVETIVK
jgi:hypothetical protein